MPAQTLTVQVHPVALFGNDLIVKDPDHPENDVAWQVTAIAIVDGVVVVEYRTGDDVEGRHGFDDPAAWVVVAVRQHRSAA